MEKQNALTVVSKPTGSKQAIVDAIKQTMAEVNIATSKISEINETSKRDRMINTYLTAHSLLLDVFALIACME